MIKKITKCCLFILILLFNLLIVKVFANNVEESTYEAKIIINGTNIEYNFETIEEAFSMLEAKESENLDKGNIYITLQLLKDVDVDTTLVAKTKRTNMEIDMNGFNIISSADPVIEIKVPISGITNVRGTPCSIVQKNVNEVSLSSPNTIIYVPAGVMSLMINAENVTFGDGIGTAVNSSAMMPMSIQKGTFLGKMILEKPMFGAAISGGLFLEDPTPHIDTNAYVALKNTEGLYYLETFHAATADPISGDIIKKYGLAQDAVDAAEIGGLIKVLKQYYPPKTVVISPDDILTFDLAGFQFTGAASPDSALCVEGTSLINNKGKLSIIDSDKIDPGAFNFVYDDDFTDECFCTILNEGELNLNDISVSVNYNQPNYNGNIFTLCNDSSNSDAVMYIDSASRIGGLKLEPEDPATGKYPAIMTKGNGNYKNAIHIGYKGNDGNENTQDDDTVIFYMENSIIGEVMDVFDNNGNYTTTLYLNNGKDLQKRNISIKKDGNEIDFEYDSETNTLTIPANNFTEGADVLEISLKYEVTYIVDGQIVEVVTIEHGKDVILPAILEKYGYIAKWDKEGKKIVEDTIITAVYTEISKDDENNEDKEEDKVIEDEIDEEGKTEEGKNEENKTEEDKTEEDKIIEDEIEKEDKTEENKISEDEIEKEDKSEEEKLDEKDKNKDNKIEKVDNAQSKKEGNKAIVDTGDHSNIELWTALLVVSFLILIISLKYDRKHQFITKYKAKH